MHATKETYDYVRKYIVKEIEDNIRNPVISSTSEDSL